MPVRPPNVRNQKASRVITAVHPHHSGFAREDGQLRSLARLLSLIVAAHLTLTGCERLPPTETSPIPVSISLDAPDASFRLDAAERANIIDEMYDPDALERLLHLVHPDYRMEILAHFQKEPFDGKRRGLLVEI